MQNEYVYIRFSFKDSKNSNQIEIDDYKIEHFIKYLINFGENNFNENIRMSFLGNKVQKKTERNKKSSIEI